MNVFLLFAWHVNGSAWKILELEKFVSFVDAHILEGFVLA
jgi:hypothetical protein